ncbi:cytochrome-c peroxidase [Hymenobacter sp. B81]|uniref:cytochrome-c peroxidase n=1 Tax=Hymenobacter sp. B81 TaxID=3344878 RepID=UPI0037DDBC35
MLRLVSYRGILAGLAAGLLLVVACKPDLDVEGPAITTPYAYDPIPRGFPALAAPADNPTTVEGVALGRRLFYDKQLSATGTQSCGSCHQQRKAFTDGLARSVGVDGRPHPRNSMSLTNIVWDQHLTWDGANTLLEQQARVPIENPLEMHQSLAEGVRKLQQNEQYPPLFRRAFGSARISEENVLKALAQFERTLVSTNSRYDRFVAGDRTALSQEAISGFALFNTHAVPGRRGAECFHCHVPPTFSAPRGEFFNNGLDLTFPDPGRNGVTGLPADLGKFKAPTLRNIALTAPYMHDGRFQTLEQVLDHYSDHVQVTPTTDGNLAVSTNHPSGRMSLSATEKRQIIAFLHALTDSTFIADPRFAAPN